MYTILIHFKCLQYVQNSYDPHVHIDCYIGMVFVDIAVDSIVDVPKRTRKSPVQRKLQAENSIKLEKK